MVSSRYIRYIMYFEGTMRKARFRRAVRKGGGRNVRDERGSVVVRIILARKGAPIRGNIVRSFTVADAKVSEVAEHIQRELFGED
jgi:hypothetical protein